MKVLQINSVFGVGSTGRIVAELGETQAANGYKPFAVYGRTPVVTDNYMAELIQVGNKVSNFEHLLEQRLFDNGGFSSRVATRRLINTISRLRPDVIHLHNLHGYYLNVKQLFNYLDAAQIPVVYTLHDCWPFSPQAAFIDLDSNGKLPTTVENVSDYDEYPKTWNHGRSNVLYRKKRKCFTRLQPVQMRVVTPSHWLTNLAEKSYLAKYKIETIHNGIDLDQFQPDQQNYLQTKYQLYEKKIILGVANIWEPRKGLSFFNQLAENLPENYQIVLVGKIADEQPNSRIISIAQTTSVSELAAIYASADVFVNPTMADNFPTTNIEALACGTPVATFATGGSAESIDGQVGQVVMPGDAKGLLAACYNLNKSELVSKNCREHAYQFDKKLAYQSYLEIYRQLVSD